MNGDIIGDVGKTLITLLENELVTEAAGGIRKEELALISPAESKTRSLLLTLFLYAIVETPELKNQPGVVIDPTQFQYPPLTLNLYYLLTTYPKSNANGSGEAIVQAHKLLGKAMRVFYDNGILAGTTLGPSIPPDEELRLTLQPITVEDLTRIWGVFPEVAYRPSVSYLVTPVRVHSERRKTSQRVVEYQDDFDHMVPNRRLKAQDGTKKAFCDQHIYLL